MNHSIKTENNDWRPLRVAVLMGGKSAEREISLKSGFAVAKAMRHSGHDVFEIDTANTDLNKFAFGSFDIAFIALHGEFGEDGQVQKILEEHKIPYTGCNSRVSANAFSKKLAKDIFLNAGVPTPSFRQVHIYQTAAQIERKVNQVGYPLVVKPNDQGSSIGVSLVTEPEQLSRAMSVAFHTSNFALLETAVLGPEFSVTVFDRDVFPATQINPENQIFDFSSKYHSETSQFDFDDQIDIGLQSSLNEVALKACDALGTSGLVRVDIRIDNQNRPWVLEVNTIPGMTTTSQAPKAAEKAGLNFEELCEEILQRSLLNFNKIPSRLTA